MEVPSLYMNKFEVKPHRNLFGINWSDVDKGLCPSCGRKLKTMRFKPLMFCSNKPCKFVMKKQ